MMTWPPPPGLAPTVSDPPEASAARRPMSRPRPVEPPPLAPRRTGSPAPKPTPKPGPESATHTRAPPPLAGPPAKVNRDPCPLGVCEDVPEQRVQAGGQLGGASADRDRRGRQRRIHDPALAPASTDQNVARSLTTCAASQLPDSPLLRWRAFSISAVTACSSAWTWPAARWPRARPTGASASASSRRAVSGVRSRWDRSAMDSAFLPDQVPDALGQVVEALGHLAHLGRPVADGARVQVAGGEPER